MTSTSFDHDYHMVAALLFKLKDVVPLYQMSAGDMIVKHLSHSETSLFLIA